MPLRVRPTQALSEQTAPSTSRRFLESLEIVHDCVYVLVTEDYILFGQISLYQRYILWFRGGIP